MEDHIKLNRNIIDRLGCCSSDIYKTQTEFSLLPGHKAVLLKIPQQIIEMKGQKRPKKMKPRESTDELKKKLIRQLNEYPKKAGFNLHASCEIISEGNIVDEEVLEDTIKCKFSCSFCTKKIPVIYNKYWWTSNATKHLKKHISDHLANNP